MNKQDYLSHAGEALSFVRWMAQHLRAESALGHVYARPHVPPQQLLNLADGLRKYEWRFGFDGVIS